MREGGVTLLPQLGLGREREGGGVLNSRQKLEIGGKVSRGMGSVFATLRVGTIFLSL